MENYASGACKKYCFRIHNSYKKSIKVIIRKKRKKIHPNHIKSIIIDMYEQSCAYF